MPNPARLRLRLRDLRPILALLAALPWWLGSGYFFWLFWPAGVMALRGDTPWTMDATLALAAGSVLAGVLVHRMVCRSPLPGWRWLGQRSDGAFWLSRARDPEEASRCPLRILTATRRVGESVWLVGEIVDLADAKTTAGTPTGATRRRRVALWIDAGTLGNGRDGHQASTEQHGDGDEATGRDALRQLRMRLLWTGPDADPQPAGRETFAPGRWRRTGVCWRDSRVATGGKRGFVRWPRILGAWWQTQGQAMGTVKIDSGPNDSQRQVSPGVPQSSPMSAYPPEIEALLSDDPGHVYSDDELDAIEALDAELALRLDRAQTFAARGAADVPADGPIDVDAVRAAVEEARRILMQDGGDIEFVEMKDRVAIVRLKGACVGCPRSTLDLRNVVERLVRSRAPGVERIANTF